MNTLTKCKTCGFDKLDVYISKVTSFGFTYDVLQCGNCGLLFRNIELSAEENAGLYGDAYFEEEQKDYFFQNIDLKQNIFAERLETVNRYCPNKGHLLEVGSATGISLQIAKDDGWKELGIELSQYASEYAQKQGLNSICGDFTTIKGMQGNFDAITFWDVIEHAEYPLELLRNAYASLKPGGFLFLATPVLDSIVYGVARIVNSLTLGTVSGMWRKGFPVHHSCYYTTTSLRQEIEAAGFEIREFLRENYGAHIYSGGPIGKISFRFLEFVASLTGQEIIGYFVAQRK